MAATPWYTSNDLISSVQRKISFPISQATFSQNDILAFANEEMFIAQVPSVLQFHEEYFVHYTITPLQTNVSRYPIPNRATGMKLRDLFWQDQNGNLFEMTRIEEHDKAFFQRNVGANQAVHKFYIEGNDVVLTPSVVNSPTGSLVFVFYLRPNQLVKNDRAAIVVGFNQLVTINNSLINPLDTVTFNIPQLRTLDIPVDQIVFTAVNSLGGTITNIQPISKQTAQITCAGHQLSNGQFVTIIGSNCNPVINATFPITVVDANTFNIPAYVQVAGSAGTFTSPNQFQIGGSDGVTAGNLTGAINTTTPLIAEIVDLSATAPNNTVNLLFSDVNTVVQTSNPGGFLIPQGMTGIQFNQVPSTYTDSETNVMGPLFVDNALVDIIKTTPGHNTYVYDVQIPSTGISANSVFFNTEDLQVPTGTVNNSAGSNINPTEDPIQFMIAQIQVGDYMCLSNESIIPQIPPDLHNGLAERTAARILAALGDQQGLQASMAKIQEIAKSEGNLLDNRSEGTPQKVVNRHSMLRYGKMGVLRRT